MAINTIIIDTNQNSIDILKSKISKVKDFNIIASYNNFSSVENGLGSIDLVFFDINSSNADTILEQINNFQKKFKNIYFVATSYEINSELVTKTLSAGVKDFMLKPVIDDILNASLNKVIDIKNNVKQTGANVITVFSNKGGMGKTSLAVNLGYEIACLRENENICILDLNFNSEDAATFLNIIPNNNIGNVLANIKELDKDVILKLIDNYENSNLYVFSTNNVLEKACTTQNILKIIGCLKNIFRWIIIDTSPLINELNLSVLNNSDMILMLGLMNAISIRNSQKMLELFNDAKFSNEKVKFIINRYIQNSDITISDIEQTTGKKVFEKIPNNYLTLIDALNIGQPVSKINPQSNIAKTYKHIAYEIINTDFLNLTKENENNYNHGIFNLLRRMGE